MSLREHSASLPENGRGLNPWKYGQVAGPALGKGFASALAVNRAIRGVRLRALFLVVAALTLVATVQGQRVDGPQGTPPSSDTFRFKSGVELVNVTATVSDSNGRFVPGLTRDDFVVYEDDVQQTVTQFSAERVPVSLGIALDTSGSMAGGKIEAAKAALDRFLYDLLGREDEIFLYRFSDQPLLLQDWTVDRLSLARALGRIAPSGGTALYDTVAEAIPMARQGRRQKKALLIISDGNDTSSRIGADEVRQLIRRSEVLVYAVGIDGDDVNLVPRAPIGRPQPRRPMPPTPRPFPGGPGRRPWGVLPQVQQPPVFGPIGGPNGGWRNTPGDDRVNIDALRDLTDDSGGRTEIVRRLMDLNPATTSIADELSKQYYLGYTSTNGEKDGKWHAIRVALKSGPYRVRARRGYVAN